MKKHKVAFFVGSMIWYFIAQAIVVILAWELSGGSMWSFALQTIPLFGIGGTLLIAGQLDALNSFLYDEQDQAKQSKVVMCAVLGVLLILPAILAFYVPTLFYIALKKPQYITWNSPRTFLQWFYL